MSFPSLFVISVSIVFALQFWIGLLACFLYSAVRFLSLRALIIFVLVVSGFLWSGFVILVPVLIIKAVSWFCPENF